MKRALQIAAPLLTTTILATACGFEISKNPDPGSPPATGDDDRTGDDDSPNSAAPPEGTEVPGSNPTPPTSSATFTQVQSRILQPNCVACHGSGGTSPNLSSYSAFAKNTRWIVPGSPKSSVVYLEVLSGSMPRGSSSLGADELKLISDWITDGALNN